MGMQPHRLLDLGCHSKEAGDEGDLPVDICFAEPPLNMASAFQCVGLLDLTYTNCMAARPDPCSRSQVNTLYTSW
jgi:hypothetical protein